MIIQRLASVVTLSLCLATQIGWGEQFARGLKEDGKVALRKVFAEVTPSQPVCFGREYSTNHMNLNPTKTVRKMSVKFSREPEYNTESLQMEIGLKGPENKFKVYHGNFICLRSEGLCAIECDGGRVYLKMDSSSRVQVINKGFYAEGGCDGESDGSIFIDAIKGADDVFNLARLPAEFCKN